jgi:hypothetical protein
MAEPLEVRYSERDGGKGAMAIGAPRHCFRTKAGKESPTAREQVGVLTVGAFMNVIGRATAFPAHQSVRATSALILRAFRVSAHGGRDLDGICTTDTAAIRILKIQSVCQLLRANASAAKPSHLPVGLPTCAGRFGDLLPPSPSAEKATARSPGPADMQAASMASRPAGYLAARS